MSRYIAVCFPFFRLRHNIKARFYIIPILLFAPLYNVPRFFEFVTVKNVVFTCLDDQLHAFKADSINISGNNIVSKEYNETYINMHPKPQPFMQEYVKSTINRGDEIHKRDLGYIRFNLNTLTEVLHENPRETSQSSFLVSSRNTIEIFRNKRSSNKQTIDEVSNY